MIKIVYFIIVLLLIIYIDGSETIKSKNPRIIAAYTSFFFIAGMLCLLLLMEIKIPSPLEPVKIFLTSVFEKS